MYSALSVFVNKTSNKKHCASSQRVRSVVLYHSQHYPFSMLHRQSISFCFSPIVCQRRWYRIYDEPQIILLTRFSCSKSIQYDLDCKYRTTRKQSSNILIAERIEEVLREILFAWALERRVVYRYKQLFRKSIKMKTTPKSEFIIMPNNAIKLLFAGVTIAYHKIKFNDKALAMKESTEKSQAFFILQHYLKDKQEINPYINI